MRSPILAGLALWAGLAFAAAASSEPATASPELVKAVQVTGDPSAGKAKSEAELCQGCHGETGHSVAAEAPHLAGQQAAYLAKQLQDFRSQTRRHQTMNALAEGLTDADIADIAAYFASQPRMAGQPSNASPAARELFLYGDANRNLDACVNCHEPDGNGRVTGDIAYPRLGGQSRGYLVVQLLNWKSAARTNSQDGVMNRIAGGLTEAELAALAEYLAGL